MKKHKILVKYPTRSRPNLFISTLMNTYLMASDKENITFLISYDDDDTEMSKLDNSVIEKMLPCKFVKGKSKNKIHACNRDIETVDGWDIVLLLSDDMICNQWGWDEIIRENFKFYPDELHHYSDGYTHQKLITLALMDKKYYDRFGYIYYPEYISLFCDNQQGDVAKILGKYRYFQQTLFRYEHYSNNHLIVMDELMQKNESYYKQDQRTYNRLKSLNFNL
jgi:hypothetical protein